MRFDKLRSSNLFTARKAGFTLIELLVVIAIIALLAAILFPVFSRVRENARRASCSSNLKQMGLGIMQYVQDFDDHWPLISGNPAQPLYTWRIEIYPYVKSSQVYSCPSNKLNRTAASGDVGFPVENIPLSYDCNRNLFPVWNKASTITSQVAGTSQFIMVAEGWDGSGDLTITRANFGIPSAGQGLFAGHLGTSNYLFADGHVKALRPTQTVAPGSSSSNPLNPDNMWFRNFPDNSYTSDTTPAAVNAHYGGQLLQAETNQP